MITHHTPLLPACWSYCSWGWTCIPEVGLGPRNLGLPPGLLPVAVGLQPLRRDFLLQIGPGTPGIVEEGLSIREGGKGKEMDSKRMKEGRRKTERRRKRDRQTDRQTDRHTELTDRQTDRHTDRQTNRHTDRQKDRQNLRLQGQHEMQLGLRRVIEQRQVLQHRMGLVADWHLSMTCREDRLLL
eukprot:sb/3471480/